MEDKQFDDFIRAKVESGELSGEKLKDVLELLQQRENYKRFNKSDYFNPYPYQKKFYELGANNRYRFLCAGNRCGKTFSAAFECFLHLTGKYPTWWKGRRFNKPINFWFMGVNVEQCKDVGQYELLGTKNAKAIEEIGSGVIPRKYIDFDSLERDGARVMRVRIKHFKNGVFDGYSLLSFKTSQSDATSIMGSHVDYAWIDELPPFDDLDIFSQLVTRTMADQAEQASVTVTGTPEKGLTPLVQHFQDKQNAGEENIAWMQAGWKDAHSSIGGHLTDSIIKTMLAGIPEYQINMRMNGEPILGDGLIFPYAIRQNNVCLPLEEIPAHWKQIGALDIGMGHETAVTWAVYDPDNDIIYITDTYAANDLTPDVHTIAINKRGRDIPIVLPRDAHQRDKSHGKDMIAYYKEAGANVLSETFYNAGRAYKGGKDNTVDTGIVEIGQRLQAQQLKIYSTCQDLIRGLETYSYKKGEIDKSGKYDDLIDSFRYAVMSVARRGKSKRDLQRSTSPILNTWIAV